jgi:DNA-binding response OmpR family regulator
MKHSPISADLVNECLWRKREYRPDERVPLTPKAFAVRRYLVDHAGQLVTHDQLPSHNSRIGARSRPAARRRAER